MKLKKTIRHEYKADFKLPKVWLLFNYFTLFLIWPDHWLAVAGCLLGWLIYSAYQKAGLPGFLALIDSRSALSQRTKGALPQN